MKHHTKTPSVDKRDLLVATDTLENIANQPAGGSGVGEYITGRIQSMAREILKYRNQEKENIVHKFEYVEVYELTDYDGADGRYNPSSGFATFRKEVAEDWCKLQNGNGYRCAKGILINSLDEVKDAKQEVEKKIALAKLSDHEKKLLGLV